MNASAFPSVLSSVFLKVQLEEALWFGFEQLALAEDPKDEKPVEFVL